MRPKTYHEYEERERRAEEFRDDLERRHRDNPAFWHWVEARHKARLADAKAEESK